MPFFLSEGKRKKVEVLKKSIYFRNSARRQIHDWYKVHKKHRSHKREQTEKL